MTWRKYDSFAWWYPHVPKVGFILIRMWGSMEIEMSRQSCHSQKEDPHQGSRSEISTISKTCKQSRTKELKILFLGFLSPLAWLAWQLDMCFPETVSQLGRRIRCDDRRSAWDRPTNYLGDWAAFASVGVHRCFGSWGHVKVGSIVNPDFVSRSPISGHIPLPHLRLSSTLTCAHEEGCDCFRLSGIFRLTSTVLVWWLHSLSVWRFWRWSRVVVILELGAENAWQRVNALPQRCQQRLAVLMTCLAVDGVLIMALLQELAVWRWRKTGLRDFADGWTVFVGPLWPLGDLRS